MKAVHVQLSDKGRDIGVLEILPAFVSTSKSSLPKSTYASTFENSGEGDMTKLSFEDDHEIR